jgi:hypothetical protein
LTPKSAPILTNRNRNRKLILSAAMARAKVETGKSPFRQAWELLRLRQGPGQVEASDYYLHGLFRDSLSHLQKQEYISVARSSRLNASMQAPRGAKQRNLIDDKLMMASVLKSAGCQTPLIIGVASAQSLPGAYKSMGTAKEVAQFLRSVSLPVFGKPRGGSLGLGVLSVFERSGDGKTGVMGDGREVLLDDLATEICSIYPDGYIFQPFVTNHPDIAQFNPKVAQALRVVTILGTNGPEVLYVTWHIPGKTALSDNNSTAGRQVIAGVDIASGIATLARGHEMFDTYEGFVVHPESGLQIEGRKLPLFEECKSIACEMHLMFPSHAILGWDVVPATTGPVILECNANPIHFGYQLGFRRGFMNPEIMARIAPILAKSGTGWRKKMQKIQAEQN